MYVVRPDEIREFGTAGHAIAGLVGPSRGARELTLLQARLAPGASTPVHQHDREEVLVLASGVLEVCCGGEVRRLIPGEVAIFPAGVDHEMTNICHEEALMLLFSGAGARSFDRNGREMPTPPWLE
jgi:quercetin dioxygenase-like cupin family protein